uniref:Uncharacterized protein n=1 Tax=Aegilops tauschii subsp. strangulata TaxID=200361 RepID=A0A453N9R3_AEGTS
STPTWIALALSSSKSRRLAGQQLRISDRMIQFAVSECGGNWQGMEPLFPTHLPPSQQKPRPEPVQ